MAGMYRKTLEKDRGERKGFVEEVL